MPATAPPDCARCSPQRAHRGADLVLLAGDTFECHRVATATIARAADAMREFALPIVILPGNHDPAIDEAVYHDAAFARVDGLHILGITHHDAALFEPLGLEVWGRPHRDYHDMEPLAEIRSRTTPWQIAMAHGHYTPTPDRSTPLRPSWLIGDADLEATAADYIALGHWNRRIKVGNGTTEAWYSGSPDYARSINLVRLRADGTVHVDHHPLDLPAGFGDGMS